MIIILDFGSQYSQLIARRIRQFGVYSEILPFNTGLKKILSLRPGGIILSGGPANVNDRRAPHISTDILNQGLPVLGICYGMQLIAFLQGGKVAHSKSREYGKAELAISKPDSLFKGLPERSVVWMSHQDRVSTLPKDFVRIASTADLSTAAMRHRRLPLFGLQFHPEVHHTQYGKQILKNFVYRICMEKPTWDMGDFIERSITELRQRVGNKRVVCAVSGGVDSTVLATLLYRAIGDRLKPVFIDNGLLRLNEAQTVTQRFKKLGIKIRHINASQRFLSKLQGVANPERKRQIIGREFIRVFLEQLGKQDLLAQGTLYPDVIESVSVKGPSAHIKMHHNLVPEVLKLARQNRVIEPLRELFKDEVREVGRRLGLPEVIVTRQPFPGPGLAVRIIGAVNKERLAVLRQADAIVIEEMKRAGLYDQVWQSFAVLLPVKSVGVMGDERTYENVIAVRAVHSVDGMTADWVRLPEEVLTRISNRIINEVKGVNRVVYDISSKPPSTIEWE